MRRALRSAKSSFVLTRKQKSNLIQEAGSIGLNLSKYIRLCLFNEIPDTHIQEPIEVARKIKFKGKER